MARDASPTYSYMSRMGRAKRIHNQVFHEGVAMHKSARSLTCVRNAGDLSSLELRKFHRLVPNAAAASEGLIRVVNESGEDYLHPDEFFVPIEVPKAAVRAFAKCSA